MTILLLILIVIELGNIYNAMDRIANNLKGVNALAGSADRIEYRLCDIERQMHKEEDDEN